MRAKDLKMITQGLTNGMDVFEVAHDIMLSLSDTISLTILSDWRIQSSALNDLLSDDFSHNYQLYSPILKPSPFQVTIADDNYFSTYTYHKGIKSTMYHTFIKSFEDLRNLPR